MQTSGELLQPLPWQKSARSPLARQLQIFGFSTRFLILLLKDRLTGERSSRKRQKRARWLVGRLTELGPTFIKIGQSLSTRADLIPGEYIEQLSHLQDRVPEFDGREAVTTVERELGRPIGSLFEYFETVPIASASLGQVHRARLLSGEEVVVKVQRPDLERLFTLDLEALLRLTRWLNLLPDFRKYDLERINREFFDLLFQEIDYVHEGRNADRFRENFKNYPRVKVPLVYWQYTTRRVLTLEYAPGIKVDDRESLLANGIDVDGVIQLGICSYLKQLLQDGFFQSDPHPGNMAVSARGELIFYDFGTMFEVKSVARARMVETFFAVLRKDTDTVLETLVYMGLIEPSKNTRAVRDIVQFLLDEFRDKPIDVRAFERIGDRVYEMFRQQPFRLPPQMTFILKSVTTLDGIARSLDPRYNLLAASQPFVRSFVISSGSARTTGSFTERARSFLKQQFGKESKSERSWRRLEEKIRREELTFSVRSSSGERVLQRIYLAIKVLIDACLMGFCLLAAIALLSTSYRHLAIVLFSLTGLFGLLFLRSSIGLSIRERVDRMAENSGSPPPATAPERER